MDIDLGSCSFRYGLIYTDPPWVEKAGSHSLAFPEQLVLPDYRGESIDAIEARHEKAFSLLEDRANVFIWAIEKTLIQTEQMMSRFGFSIHARLIWDKGNGVSPGGTIRFSHEYLLWCYRKGHMLRPDRSTAGSFSSVIHSPVHGVYSKPMCVYTMLEMMFPQARKLELYARFHRDGWDQNGILSGVLDNRVQDLS